jgi:hypothetical protein
MSDARWKNTEREVMKLLGGERVPVSGRGDGPDGVSERLPWISVEIKDRAAFPKSWTLALAQAEKAANEYQLALSVWHERGRHHSNDIVMMRLGDFVDFFGGDDTLEAA